jgi:hypothetical protein
MDEAFWIVMENNDQTLWLMGASEEYALWHIKHNPDAIAFQAYLVTL